MPHLNLLATCSIRFSGLYLDRGRHIICGWGLSLSINMCKKCWCGCSWMINEMEHILHLNLVRETPGQEEVAYSTFRDHFTFPQFVFLTSEEEGQSNRPQKNAVDSENNIFAIHDDQQSIQNYRQELLTPLEPMCLHILHHLHLLLIFLFCILCIYLCCIFPNIAIDSELSIPVSKGQISQVPKGCQSVS